MRTATRATSTRARNTHPRARPRAGYRVRARHSASPANVGVSTLRGSRLCATVVFLNNRYHDPGLGRFISVDPLVAKTGQAYAYGTNNPITYSDPTGLEPCSWCDSDDSVQYDLQAVLGWLDDGQINDLNVELNIKAAEDPFFDEATQHALDYVEKRLGIERPDPISLFVFDPRACKSAISVSCGIEVAGAVPIGKGVKAAGKLIDAIDDVADVARVARKGKWMSAGEFAEEEIRDARNIFRTVEGATEAGRHGAGLRAAARELRERAAKNGYLPEINDALKKAADRFEAKANGIDHPGGRR